MSDGFCPGGTVLSADAFPGTSCLAWSLDVCRKLECGWSRVFGPTGQESLAQGLPWVLVYEREALKGRPLTRRQEPPLEMPRPLQGFSYLLGCFLRVNPGLSSPGPSGQRLDSIHPGFGKCPNSSPGTPGAQPSASVETTNTATGTMGGALYHSDVHC
jgi:hypothetical protein